MIKILVFLCHLIFFSFDLFAVKVTTMPNGWFTYWPNMANYLQPKIYSENDFDNLAYQITDVEQKLKNKKITFLWMVPPNTTTLYSESIPRRMVTRHDVQMDQLKQYDKAMSKRNLLNFFNLTPTLEEHKKDGQLYQKTDTHWNQLGAYYGYVAVMHRLYQLREIGKEELMPLELNKFFIQRKKTAGGDLAAILGISDFVLEDQILLNRTPERPELIIKKLDQHSIYIKNAYKCPGLRLLMFHDSFETNIRKFIAENFCETWFINSFEAEKKWFDIANPHVVMLETVERNIDVWSYFFPSIKKIFESEKKNGF